MTNWAEVIADSWASLMVVIVVTVGAVTLAGCIWHWVGVIG